MLCTSASPSPLISLNICLPNRRIGALCSLFSRLLCGCHCRKAQDCTKKLAFQSRLRSLCHNIIARYRSRACALRLHAGATPCCSCSAGRSGLACRTPRLALTRSRGRRNGDGERARGMIPSPVEMGLYQLLLRAHVSEQLFYFVKKTVRLLTSSAAVLCGISLSS